MDLAAIAAAPYRRNPPQDAAEMAFAMDAVVTVLGGFSVIPLWFRCRYRARLACAPWTG